MKIKHIQIEGVLGARLVETPITKPITLFAGLNCAGKSSIQEAIRMALLGETVRVSLKKNYGELLTDGQKGGIAYVGWDAGNASFAVPIGVHEVNGTLPQHLAFALDAQRFSKLDANERRTFLFGLMGLSSSGTAVRERLDKKKCDPKKVEQIAPLLRAGFDAASKEAAQHATKAKGAWREITAETYGSKKGASWKAPEVAFDQVKYKEAQDSLAEVEADLEGAVHSFGELQAEAAQSQKRKARIAELQAIAAKGAGVRGKIAADTSVYQEAQKALEAARAVASGAPLPDYAATRCHCPSCGSVLDFKDGKLTEALIPLVADAPNVMRAQEQLQQAELTMSLQERIKANNDRDLAAINNAVAALLELEKEGPTDYDGKLLAEQLAKVEAMKLERKGKAEAVQQLARAQLAAEAQAQKTKRAAELHADIVAWTEIADALSPDGIPGEMLAEALEPINSRLAQSAVDADWGRVGIEKDMSITMGFRDYSLLSESERWRADAMIAEAIAFLSGCKLLVLDRFDVLDVPGRDDLFAWLDALAGAGEIDSALIFGTLRAIPANLPPTIESHWIEGGVLQNLEQAA